MPDSPSNQPADTKFLTIAETASVLRVSKMDVYLLVHQRALPAIRVGQTHRIPESAVQEYLRRTEASVNGA
ncbi:helix-turn-helix domain-containing protein [Streptomyces sp. NPDC002088]|uniref:helix-turn-helix domain-containing protein n=1 Tax=Streptomyces sp. NPDC002088 TaxID=3154665 RepID=UPI0033314758